MTTWTEQSPSSGGWALDYPVPISMQIAGTPLGLLLVLTTASGSSTYADSPFTRQSIGTGGFTRQSINTGGFTKVVPNSGSWTEEVPN